MRVLTALLAAAVLATTASAQVGAKSPGKDDPGSFPTWSPDGSRLTFTRGRDSVVIQVAGVPRLAAASRGWRLVAGRKKLAFVRSSKVYVGDANGADPRQIAEGHDFVVVPRQPSARDHEHLTLRGRLRRYGPAADCAAGSVYDVSRPVPHHPELVSARGLDRIRRRHQSRRYSRQWHDSCRPARRERRAGRWGHALPIRDSWSPDGRWLGYSDSSDFSDQTAFFLARESDGFRSRFVGDGDGGTWAPTSRYVIRRSGGDLFVTRPEGGASRIKRASFPSWSPDGALLAFQRGDRSSPAARPAPTCGSWPGGAIPTSHRVGRSPMRASAAAREQGIHVIRPDGRGDRRLTTACSISGDYGNEAILAGAEAQFVTASPGTISCMARRVTT